MIHYKNIMIRFGPSGNDVLFWQQGYKSSIQAPKWLKDMGLNAFEVSFGRGIRMTEKTAEQIGEKAKEHDIAISAHAPYFINLASNDPQTIAKSYGYIEKSLKLLRIMGGNKLVIHAGSQGEMEREQAIANIKKNLKWVITELNKSDLRDLDYLLCIETMGRFKAIGTYQEICDICKIDRHVIPTLDFGHINCILQGALKTYDDFAAIMNYCEEQLTPEKLQKVHIHFSSVVFGEKGERKHTTLADPKYGVPFNHLAKIIKEKNLEPTIICESQDIMAQDAVKLKQIFIHEKD